MISIQEVHVYFDRGTPLEKHVLRGLTLEIPAGQFCTLIGSNGAGKSTLLGVLSGQVAVESGRIVIDGVDVTKMPPSQRSRYVARVFQDPMAGTCSTLTIEENMALAMQRGASRGLGIALRRQWRPVMTSALAALGLGLEHRLRDAIGLLSGGQRQAVSLVMATLAGAKLLMLDEHTAALDPATAALVLQLTDDCVAKHGLTTLMVTHSMRQALDHGTRLLMLDQGEVALDVSGETKAKLSVGDLVTMFGAKRRGELDADALVAS